MYNRPKNYDDESRTALRAELAELTTEAVDESMRNLDMRPTDALVLAMNAQDQTVSEAVARVAPVIALAIDAITARMREGGRLIYIGAGTSGRLGILDASECPPTFSTDPSLVVGVIAGGDVAIRTAVEGAEDDEEAGARDLQALSLAPKDVVVGISASGRTPYVAGAIQFANAANALTVAVACNSGSKIGALAQLAIEVVVGPEFLAGSTRLKAGTAQKLVLNMLSTLTMVRLGKTYGNIMVDLKVTNEKLSARAERTIMSVTGVPALQATSALADAGGSVKEAIFAIMTGLPAESARDGLTLYCGHLRNALEASKESQRPGKTDHRRPARTDQPV